MSRAGRHLLRKTPSCRCRGPAWLTGGSKGVGGAGAGFCAVTAVTVCSCHASRPGLVGRAPHHGGLGPGQGSLPEGRKLTEKNRADRGPGGVTLGHGWCLLGWAAGRGRRKPAVVRHEVCTSLGVSCPLSLWLPGAGKDAGAGWTLGAIWNMWVTHVTPCLKSLAAVSSSARAGR